MSFEIVDILKCLIGLQKLEGFLRLLRQQIKRSQTRLLSLLHEMRRLQRHVLVKIDHFSDRRKRTWVVGALFVNLVHLLDLEVSESSGLILAISLDAGDLASSVAAAIADDISLVDGSVLEHCHDFNWTLDHQVPIVV